MSADNFLILEIAELIDKRGDRSSVAVANDVMFALYCRLDKSVKAHMQGPALRRDGIAQSIMDEMSAGMRKKPA